VLYVLALVPAICFEDLGVVLAATGAFAGSCLSYIGPGLTYLGAHGAAFLDVARLYFGKSYWPKHDDEETTQQDAWYAVIWKSLVWYCMLMPLWCTIATVGSIEVRRHHEDMALKSPHPIRIGMVHQTRTLEMVAKKLESSDKDFAPLLIRSDSLHMVGDRMSYEKKMRPDHVEEPIFSPQSSAVLEEAPPEEDPQADPPRVIDFAIAVGYMIFGVIALTAGLVSIATGE
jgi:sodium-coupled neutral amino acid transporter 11